MNAFVRALVAAAIASVPFAAFAGESAKGQAKLRKVVHDYAICVVRNHHAKASEAVLAMASNSDIRGALSQILDSDCLGAAAGMSGDMRFPKDTYRYALADALVSADFANQGDTSFANRLPLAQPALISPDEQTKLLAKTKNNQKREETLAEVAGRNVFAWVARYGECVVRADPVNARYWLLTPPETPEEMSRIKAMQPAFSGCLGDGTVHFNRSIIRGTVAVNYYRLAMATVMPGARSGS